MKLTPHYQSPNATLYHGDARQVLAGLPEGIAQMCVTSPPYWGLRDYGTAKWEGGSPDCDHTVDNQHQKQGATSQRAGRANVEAQRNDNFKGLCGKCGAVRTDDQIGLEAIPDCLGWATGAECGECYVCHIVATFREVWRTLKDDGVLWLNLGDTYATGGGKVGRFPGGGNQGERRGVGGAGLRAGTPPGRRDGGGRRQRVEGETAPEGLVSDRFASRAEFYGGRADGADVSVGPLQQPNRLPLPGLKPKDLIGIPWRVALALQADGWYLRSDVIWVKPNPMPESVEDRPTKSHEHLFLFAKNEQYFYDHEAIKEPVQLDTVSRYIRGRSGHHKHADGGPGNQTIAATFSHMTKSGNKQRKPGSARGCPDGNPSNVCGSVPWEGSNRNKRDVWTVTTSAYSEAHFATFPPALVQPCIRAGSRPGDVVLDPFNGAGTTGMVALTEGRRYVGIDVNAGYLDMSRKRLDGVTPPLEFG